MKILIVVLFFPLLVFGQYFQIHLHKESRKGAKGYEYEFPLIVHKFHPEIAENINKILQKEELDTLITPGKTGAFSKNFRIENNDGTWSGGTTYSKHEILRNDSILFIIKFNIEGCGAYCESYNKIYNFNSQTGEWYNMKNIFTKEGQFFIEYSLNGMRIKEINDYIKKLKIENKNPKKYDTERNLEQIEMYKSCTEFKTEFPKKYKRDDYWTFLTDNDDLIITDTILKINGERCSNHASQAIDELYTFENKLLLYKYVDCFNPTFIHDLKLNRKEIKTQELYSGLIGEKTKIILMVTEYINGEKKGIYLYLNQGIPIDLNVKKDNKTIIFDELNKKNQISAVFDLQTDSEYLIGFWQEKNNSKILPVKFWKHAMYK